MLSKIFKGKPEPLYIYRPVINAYEVIAWAKANGFDTTLLASDLHVTVAYSKSPVTWVSMGDAPETVFSSPLKLARFGKEGEAVVLLLDAPLLQLRFKELQKRGCSWDYEAYQPHLTLSYNMSTDVDLSSIPLLTGPIILGAEVFDPIDNSWSDNLVEKSM